MDVFGNGGRGWKLPSISKGTSRLLNGRREQEALTEQSLPMKLAMLDGRTSGSAKGFSFRAQALAGK